MSNLKLKWDVLEIVQDHYAEQTAEQLVNDIEDIICSDQGVEFAEKIMKWAKDENR